MPQHMNQPLFWLNPRAGQARGYNDRRQGGNGYPPSQNRNHQQNDAQSIAREGEPFSDAQQSQAFTDETEARTGYSETVGNETIPEAFTDTDFPGAAVRFQHTVPYGVVQQRRPSANTQSNGNGYTEGYLGSYELPSGTTVLPLAERRRKGSPNIAYGVVSLAEAGYYILIWEAQFKNGDPDRTLNLGINEQNVQLTGGVENTQYSGQQITWLNAGDQISLRLVNESDSSAENAKLQIAQARLTAIQLA